jgi:hypothetical protein
MKTNLGRKVWAIPEGYIPEYGQGLQPEFTSHEAFCVLNVTDEEAKIDVTIFYHDRDPAGPYVVTVGARRTRHFRFNELTEPEPIPRGKEYASLFESSVPVVIQHTRLDSRQAANALMTTMAYPGPE